MIPQRRSNNYQLRIAEHHFRSLPTCPDFFPQTSSMSLPNTTDTETQLQAVPSPTKPGVVYVGRIPHGFHEHQMRSYFSQFGSITRLRLSRSRKTGQSRHFAFIEFEEEEVAKIVAGTMDHYLLFGHILKCKIVPKENLHENIWKGANKRFKKVPWNSLEGQKHDLPKCKTKWEKKIAKEQKKREKTVEKMKEVGYDLELPRLKGCDEVEKTLPPGRSMEEEEQDLVTSGDIAEGSRQVVVSEEVSTKEVEGETIREVVTKASKQTKRVLDDGAEADGRVVKKTRRSNKQNVANG